MLTLFSPAFCLFLVVARIFPLHLPGVLERRRFEAASQSWKDICQSFLEFPESMVALEAACPLGAATCKCWMGRRRSGSAA